MSDSGPDRPPFHEWPVTEDKELGLDPPAATEPPSSSAEPARAASQRRLGVRLLALLILGSAAVGALVVVAFGSSSPNGSSNGTSQSAPVGPTPTTSPGVGRRPALPTDPDQSALDQLVVQQGDVAPDETVGLITGGDSVAGQPTLDLCNGTFASESSRTARLQVAAADAQSNAVLSTEAVLYQNPNATAQAFTELRNTADHCPATVVPSPVGEPALKTTFNPPPDGTWPQTPTVDRLAYDFVTSDERGQTQHSIAVYLRRGRFLLGLYFPQPDGPQAAVDGKTSIPDIVTVFASRLAKLPDASVNRSVPSVSLSSSRNAVVSS